MCATNACIHALSMPAMEHSTMWGLAQAHPNYKNIIVSTYNFLPAVDDIVVAIMTTVRCSPSMILSKVMQISVLVLLPFPSFIVRLVLLMDSVAPEQNIIDKSVMSM